MGWKSKFGTGIGGDTIGSGLEVTWTTTPTKSNNREPVWLRLGADQEPDRGGMDTEEWRRRRDMPDAHNGSKHHAPSMLTTDLALSAYEKISRRFHEHPEELADAC